MQFYSAREIEQLVWNLKLADYQRSLNRARINSLANGDPPLMDDEDKVVNVNDLSLTRLCHDARLQLSQAFNKPGNFFTARTDMGASSHRMERGTIVTKLINKIMKRSDRYLECQRSKFGSTVLHGIGPGNWEDSDHWCPIALGIEEVLVPSNTFLTFRNLPFIALQRSYTALELQRLTRNVTRNPGWNMDVVERAVKWADEQTSKMYGGTTWQEYWSPEKQQERLKQDNGIYGSDLVQTIDCWDFYFWDDSKNHSGWRRRIIFDAYGGYGSWNSPSGYGEENKVPEKNLIEEKGVFLYDSGDRVVRDDLKNIVHFQFADLSAVFPARYHSVRSLGFMLYAACHLQNRTRCSLGEAMFENLCQYFRVNTSDEAQRALKIELYNRGIIDPSVQFVSPNERWQPNMQLIELGLNEYKQTIADNSSSYVQNQNLSKDRVEKTKFQVMAEVNAMQTLVSSGLQLAYRYQDSEYREIFRRFMRKDSTDPDVREFRAQCLKAGVPERLLVPDAWDIESDKIIGGGNKTMEMSAIQLLMQNREKYPAESQDKILRLFTLGTTDDAALAIDLVPEEDGVSDDKQAAMNAFGTMMVGGEWQPSKRQNLLEVTRILIGQLALSVKQTNATGGMPSQDRLMGMQNVLKHISEFIAQIAEDDAQKEVAKQLADTSGKLANQVKAFGQRLAQAQKAQAQNNGNGGADKAKIMATLMTAKVKSDNARQSHADRTAQKQLSWEAEEKRKQQDHQFEMRRKIHDVAVDTAAKDLETAAKVRMEKKKPKSGTADA